MIQLLNPSLRVYDERPTGGTRQGLRKVQVGHGNSLGVYLNVISTKAVGDGWLEVWADGPQPPSSALNYNAGADNNMVLFVPVAGDGTIQIFTSSLTQLIVDVRGYIADLHYVLSEG
jgi:hypothetical protein